MGRYHQAGASARKLVFVYLLCRDVQQRLREAPPPASLKPRPTPIGLDKAPGGGKQLRLIDVCNNIERLSVCGFREIVMDDKQFTRVAKALADARRFEMFRVIASREEISCGAIAQRFPIGQSTVSHHLKVLGDAGLVEVRREGQHGYFSARVDILEAYMEELRLRIGLNRRSGASS